MTGNVFISFFIIGGSWRGEGWWIFINIALVPPLLLPSNISSQLAFLIILTGNPAVHLIWILCIPTLVYLYENLVYQSAE